METVGYDEVEMDVVRKRRRDNPLVQVQGRVDPTVDSWLEVLKDPIDKPTKSHAVAWAIGVAKDLVEWSLPEMAELEKEASREGVLRAALIREALQMYLAKRK